MLRKAALAVVAIAIIVASLYRFGGLRISRDGSGVWPRLFSSEPNDEALEADRARQREQYGSAPSAANTHAGPADGGRTPGAGPDKARPTADDARPADAGRTADFGPNQARSAAGNARPVDVEPGDVGRPSGPPTGRPGGYWPDFRGPNRDGRYDETAIR